MINEISIRGPQQVAMQDAVFSPAPNNTIPNSNWELVTPKQPASISGLTIQAVVFGLILCALFYAAITSMGTLGIVVLLIYPLWAAYVLLRTRG